MTLARMLPIVLLMVIGSASVLAQSYPAKPVKIIVPTSAGGITDILGRLFGQAITSRTGQAVVIDNRAGGGGNIGTEALIRATPDGYTLGGVNNNVIINHFLYPNLAFNALTDLQPVAPLGTVPLFLAINGDLPVKTLAEFVAYAKAKPDKITYASGGAGSNPDMTAGEFARRAGFSYVSVPFRGTAPATVAVITGNVDATVVSLGPYIDFVRQGKLRVLAVAAEKRVAYLPDVPTFIEEGFPDFVATTWFAVLAPRGTPTAIVDQLNGYARDLASNPEARKVTEASFVDPLVMGAGEFADYVKVDAERWGRIVRASGIKME